METFKIQIEYDDYVYSRTFTCHPNDFDEDAKTAITADEIVDAAIHLLGVAYGEKSVLEAVKKYADELTQDVDGSLIH